MPEPTISSTRPQVIDDVSRAYSDRAKGVVLLSGNIHDLFPSPKTERYVDLGYTIYHHLSNLFTVLRLDISSGLESYHADDLKELQEAVNKADSATVISEEKVGPVAPLMAGTLHSPLSALVVMHRILKAVKKARVDLKSVNPTKPVKPLCVVVRFAGSLFPAGEFNGLSEIDRQKLVTFLNLIESQWFRDSGHLLLLLADTRSEVNSRIHAQPTVQSVEIELPGAAARKAYVESIIAAKPQSEAPPKPILFEPNLESFLADTAGLSLNVIGDMLEAARRTGARIGRKEVLAEINMAMRADLGDIISIKMPEHRPSDIIGYELTGTILRKVLTRCEKPETAIASFLLSGPNGAGKTYNLEAYAAESGRVVIELVGLRGMYYGQTDGFFEKLRLRLKTYGKILILVDEAHTQFGSVHKSDTHETEKRLAGNIIKMMSDPTLLGKVVWALGTSRPDELDPDVKSRSPVQIPIFDLEGKERLDYVVSLFERAGIKVAEEELAQVLEATANYSNRDLRDLVKEVKGSRSSVLETLQFWQASSSILQQRLMQTLIAAQHCSYPQLIPPKLKELIASGELDAKVRQLKAQLLH
jgi:hypothetical protein